MSEIVDIKSKRSDSSNNLSVETTPATDFNRTDKFPWSFVDDGDKEFWCQRLGLHVKLTPNIESNGTYYVFVSQQSKHRLYPVKGHELVLSDDKSAKRFVVANTASTQLDLFPVNKTNWTQIKNFMCEAFIPSYAWGNTPDKTSDEIKQLMLSLTKNPRQGLARTLELDKESNGYYTDKVTFSERMKVHNEQFPWLKFAEFLDFSLPQT